MVIPGEHADGLPVQEHLGPVADLADPQHGRPGQVDRGLVQGQALVLADLVGGHQPVAP